MNETNWWWSLSFTTRACVLATLVFAMGCVTGILSADALAFIVGERLAVSFVRATLVAVWGAGALTLLALSIWAVLKTAYLVAKQFEFWGFVSRACWFYVKQKRKETDGE